MHIPDGFISASTAAVTGAISAGGVAYAVRTGKRRLSERQVPLVGLTAAFVFAAQMVNFPIGLGTSGHLLGGALAAILLGPWMGALVLAVVLLVQAIGFADGGITALGANISWALLATLGGYVLFRALVAVAPRTRLGFLAATAVTSWATVVAGSGLVAGYLLLNGFPAGTVPVMLGLHALIGIGEAVITTAVVSAVAASRPDLMATAHLLPAAAAQRDRRPLRGFVLVGGGLTLLVAVVLSSFAAATPDGLESTVLVAACEGDEQCLADLAGEPALGGSPLADYALTPLSGAVGVAATFAVGAGVVVVARGRRREAAPVERTKEPVGA